MKFAATCFAAILGLLALGWIAQGNDFFMYRFFAPRQEAVRRQVFETSRAFNQGMVQELQNMQFEYLKQPDPSVRASLASVILHRASGYNMNDSIVPADLRDFVDSLKRPKGEF